MTLLTRTCLLLAVVMSIGLSAQEQPLKPIKERVILFAPVSVGEEIAKEYPQAANVFASDMAERINVLVPGAKAWASDTIPGSDDPAWLEGSVGAASGAHLVVLTKVESFEEVQSVSGVTDNSVVKATVTLRAMDVFGEQKWFKTVVGQAPLAANPKNIHPAGQPGKSAWEGCKKGLLAFKYWLTQTGEEEMDKTITSSGDPEPEALTLIDLVVESEPAGADIYVNNIFRGRTPTKVPLPVAEIQLRLNKKGFEPWSRDVTPTEGMKLAPVLKPLP